MVCLMTLTVAQTIYRRAVQRSLNNELQTTSKKWLWPDEREKAEALLPIALQYLVGSPSIL